MPDSSETATYAVPKLVPLAADPVESPRLVYGSMPIQPGSWRGFDAVLFPMRDDSIGRVTFEGLDSIRAARGESLPYRRQGGPRERDEWVYVVYGSGWLQERHDYEFKNYQTPLIDRYDHYLFAFHDEFIEAIALGIWLDRPDAANPLKPPEEHPLLELGEATAVDRAVTSNVAWELRANPTPTDELLAASCLCSQRLLQYNLVLDARSREHASVWLRTRHGRTVSSFVTGFFGRERVTADGIAKPGTFADRWASCVEAVAARRREMGLQ